MVSLDVVNLFTNVPTDETLTGLQDKLATDPSLEGRTCIPKNNLMEMLTFCMKTGSNIYRLEEGQAMKSPLSPVLANVLLWYLPYGL